MNGMTDKFERDLAREHQARTLRTRAEIEGRPSRADERSLTAEARKREQLEDDEREQQRLAEQAERVADFRRRVAHAITALERVREPLAASGGRRSDVKYIDHHCRWLRRLADDVSRDS